MTPLSDSPVKLIIPKGRLQDKVLALLAHIGIELTFSHRSYRPVCSDPEVSVKLVKAQNIPSLIALDRHDAGFTGKDWVLENEPLYPTAPSKPVELLDLGFNPVQIVAAVPEELAHNNSYKTQRIVIASEYQVLTEKYIAQNKLDAYFIKTYGATEALPPEDADMIVDNTATGATLRQNRLTIVDELLRSTTCFVGNQKTLNNCPAKKEKLEQMILLMESTLRAQKQVLLEMNVPTQSMDGVLAQLPCLKSPTVTQLHGNEGFAVKAAVPAKSVPQLIPQLKAAGATDILEYKLERLVP